jgi:hypothetical protein
VCEFADQCDEGKRLVFVFIWEEVMHWLIFLAPLAVIFWVIVSEGRDEKAFEKQIQGEVVVERELPEPEPTVSSTRIMSFSSGGVTIGNQPPVEISIDGDLVFERMIDENREDH